MFFRVVGFVGIELIDDILLIQMNERDIIDARQAIHLQTGLSHDQYIIEVIPKPTAVQNINKLFKGITKSSRRLH